MRPNYLTASSSLNNKTGVLPIHKSCLFCYYEVVLCFNFQYKLIKLKAKGFMNVFKIKYKAKDKILEFQLL